MSGNDVFGLNIGHLVFAAMQERQDGRGKRPPKMHLDFEKCQHFPYALEPLHCPSVENYVDE
jgi:hypothetical protein